MYLQLHVNLFLSDTSVLRTTLHITKKLEQLFSSSAPLNQSEIRLPLRRLKEQRHAGIIGISDRPVGGGHR